MPTTDPTTTEPASEQSACAGGIVCPRSGVLALSGWRLALGVHAGHLRLSEGVDGDQREGCLTRTAGLRRLLLIGRTGYITLSAVGWLHDVGAHLLLLDYDGAPLLRSASLGRDVPQLRRAQALAVGSDPGLALVRALLREKLDGQARLMARLDPPTAALIRQQMADLESATSPASLRTVEGQAAYAYWARLAPLPLRFTREQASTHLPAHWRTVGSRLSMLSGSPRQATSPAHALLNYLYALLEGEAHLACLGVGLDPGLGLLHADQPARPSLLFDLMEPVRPSVDAWWLALLQRRTFRARDFIETARGECRLRGPRSALAEELAQTLPHWRKAIAPVAERVADALLHSLLQEPGKRLIATPLTQQRRSEGRAPFRRHPARLAPESRPQATCRQCGDALPRGREATCSDTCYRPYMREVVRPANLHGTERLQALRAQGQDPSRSTVALTSLGETQRQRAAARGAWERTHDRQAYTAEAFRRDVLPGLAEQPLSALMRTTGLSVRYCSLIRRGESIPHPLYWEALRTLTNPAPARDGHAGGD